MKRPWFKEWGPVYRPDSWKGLWVTLLAVLFCIQAFLVVDRRSHSVSDTFYGILPYVVPAFLALWWIASKTSKARG